MLDLIDIGANLTNSRFLKDLDDVIANAKAQGVNHIIVTGTSVTSSQEAVTLAEKYPTMLSTTSGVHPHDAKEWNQENAAIITQIARQESVVALGECGLDFFRDFSPRGQQIHCFEHQLDIATVIEKPVFLHQRDAHNEFLGILKQYRDRLNGAVVHCFTGDTQQAFDYLDQNCFIGVTGWLCDPKRGEDLRQAVKSIPTDRLMIETDAPYLLPKNIKPKPKSSRNEPALLPKVLSSLAEILDMDVDTLGGILSENTRSFFSLQR